MRILFATSNIPSPTHDAAGAVAVVAFEAATALREAGHEVVVQPLLGATSTAPRARLDVLREHGLDLEEPLVVPSPRGDLRAMTIRRALAPSVSAFYSAAALRPSVRERAAAQGCDLVFELWSPDALAACSTVDAPVFDYQGNPDHLPEAARVRHPALFEIGTSTVRQRAFLALRRRAVANWEQEHLALMATTTWTANNSALDADFYARNGHLQSHYVQNMWPDAYESRWREKREAPAAEARMIVGNIGNLRSTGNTFGLHFLGTEIVPALDRLLGDAFAVHVFGNDTPRSLVAAALDHPRVRVRGWVDDIDAEIAAAGVFLLANNSCEDFRVGHTRVLHAWALGACLVAHENIALAMPEIVHGRNALLGRTGEEIAEHLAVVLDDPDLRRKLGDAGRATYEEHFAPSVVVGRILDIVGA